MSSSKYPFLLISVLGDFWNQVLEDALAPLGLLQVAAEESAMGLVIKDEYAAIIIVAGNVSNFGLLTSRVRAQQPRARVIIVSTSLTWQRAREAFRSGATDYIFQSVDKAELLALVKTALAKPLTPWPQ
jgi:DNA-binding NarL/FixJ family response regulator